MHGLSRRPSASSTNAFISATYAGCPPGPEAVPRRAAGEARRRARPTPGRRCSSRPTTQVAVGAGQLHPDVVAAAVVARPLQRDQRAVVEGEHRSGLVDVAALGEEVRTAVGADGVDLDHLAAGDPAQDVEVVHVAVAEDAAGGRRCSQRRVARGRAVRACTRRSSPSAPAAARRGPRRSRRRTGAGSRSGWARRSRDLLDDPPAGGDVGRRPASRRTPGSRAGPPRGSSSAWAVVAAAMTTASTPRRASSTGGVADAELVGQGGARPRRRPPRRGRRPPGGRGPPRRGRSRCAPSRSGRPASSTSRLRRRRRRPAGPAPPVCCPVARKRSTFVLTYGRPAVPSSAGMATPRRAR